MSGDVQPRKRKDKRKKKDEEDILHHHGSIGGADEVIHIHKESKLGGNACAKLVFFGLLAVLGVMIGLIIVEYHGTNDVDTQSSSNSPWSVMLEGWVDDSINEDSHGDDEESHAMNDHDHDTHDYQEHDDDDDDEEDDDIFDDDVHDSEDEEINEIDDDDDDYDDENEGDDEENTNREDEEEEIDYEEDKDESEESEFEEDEDEVDIYEGDEAQDNEDEGENEDNEDEDYEDDEGEDNVEEEEDEDNVEEDDEDEELFEETDKYKEEADDEEEEFEKEDDPHEFVGKRVDKRNLLYDDEVGEVKDASNNKMFGKHNKAKLNNKLGTWNIKKRENNNDISNSKIKYIHKILERLRKEDKTFGNEKSGTKPLKHNLKKDKDEEVVHINQENAEWTASENSQDSDTNEEEPMRVDSLSDIEDEEDETSGVAFKFGVGVALVFVAHVVLIRKWSEGDNSKLLETVEHVPERDNIPPSFIERRQTLIPAEIMEDTTPIFLSEENEYAEEQHEDESEEEVDNSSIVNETYQDLKASYSQITPEESETEVTEEDISLKLNEYATTESEPEASESEEEEEEPQVVDPLGQWKSDSAPELLAEEVEVIQTESETEEESEDELSSSLPVFEGPKSIGSEDPLYDKSDITNEGDWEIKDELDDADKDLDDGNLTSALTKFTALVTSYPHSARALYGKARALDMIAESQQSNTLLTQAITTYSAALNNPLIPNALILIIANRTIDRMRFKGLHLNAVELHKKLIDRFPANITHRLDLAITYLMINRLESAQNVLQVTCKRWPDDMLCRGYLGLTLKLLGLGFHEAAITHLNASVQSDDPRTVNSHFYFHLGDALQRKQKNNEAMKVYSKGVLKGIFRSIYQRSMYNVDRLKAQPWWTIEETTYGSFLKNLESHWKVIREEGLAAYKETQGYLDEAESLRDTGNWKQFELFARGKKNHNNCKKTPVTCDLIEEMSVARNCRRGQSKFSMMEGGTHVWPHCGPTNCRLRAHLGLVIPPGTSLRVAQQTRSWEEGKLFVFDDSFEHEVWHNGTTHRLVLIVDVWHPELTTAEQNSLSVI